jgi:hypothetical protein
MGIVSQRNNPIRYWSEGPTFALPKSLGDAILLEGVSALSDNKTANGHPNRMQDSSKLTGEEPFV